MEILISIFGAASAILVAVVSALFSYKNNYLLQLRKLKEEHYISYIIALHNLAAYNTEKTIVETYTYHRDKLLVIGSEEVVRAIINYENGKKEREEHDQNLSVIIRAIRKDLMIKDKNFPNVSLRKG